MIKLIKRRWQAFAAAGTVLVVGIGMTAALASGAGTPTYRTSIQQAQAALSSAQQDLSNAAAAPVPTVTVTATATVTASPTDTAPPESSPVESPTPSPTVTSGPQGQWTPTPGVAWQWEISSPLTTKEISEPVQAFDIDGFDNTAATVAAIHAAGKHAICYLDVGTAENFRSDYKSFPTADLGKANGWPGEKWLNVNDSALRPIMINRIEMCASKGFDAVEPDNMDGSENSTGFTITNAQQDAYDTWIASTVHSFGMSVAQKNFVDNSKTLEPAFDFVIDEQCVQYSECTDLSPYTSAGKAVLDVEYKYGLTNTSWCAKLPGGVQGMAKNLDLDDPFTSCPGTSNQVNT